MPAQLHAIARLSDLTDPEKTVCVFAGEAIAAYGFGEGHPFGPDRHGVFMREFEAQGLNLRTCVRATASATESQLALFHTDDYIRLVKDRSQSGRGFLDYGDTPAVKGIFEAASAVAGTAIAACDAVMAGECARAFVPIAGLHHAARDHAAGFCVFNDCGIVLEHLRRNHSLDRVAYVDIDAHHGDGVFYAFEDRPWLSFIDIHEDGRYLYPGTGAAGERGTGKAAGSKLNIPLPPGAGDREFMRVWGLAEAFLLEARPEFILLQCGADSLAGDPITHLRYSESAHAHAAARLAAIADELGHGRVMAVGGGGYNRPNLARAWCAVVAAFVTAA